MTERTEKHADSPSTTRRPWTAPELVVVDITSVTTKGKNPFEIPSLGPATPAC